MVTEQADPSDSDNLPAMEDSHPLLILVPAWNEEEALGLVLDELATLELPHDVVVIDDGSTDATAEVARTHGATVLSLPLNLGVGGAMRAGYRWAVRQGYQYSVQLDADGQHRPCEVSAIMRPVLQGELDLCVGSRFGGAATYTVSGSRRFAMRVLSWVISILTKIKLDDTTSGFKAANLRAMRVFAQDFPMEYLGDTVEALIIGHKAGLRIGQVSVSMRPRQAGDASHDPWRSALFLARALSASLVASTRRATPAGAR